MTSFPRVGFTKLRTRVAVLFAGLCGLGLITLLIVAQVVIRDQAQRSVTAELQASGKVYDRIWAMREQSLATAAQVVVRDFGFRSAVASGDRPTILSAVDTLRTRTGASAAAVVSLDGRVIVLNGPLATAVGRLPFSLPDGRADAVICFGHDTFRLVVTPILAPTAIGWAVVAVRLDRAELSGLERLSAIPIMAAILQRDARGHWHGADRKLPSGTTIDALVAQAGHPAVVNFSTGSAFALVSPLPGLGDGPQAALLLLYSTDLALAPFRPIQLGIVLAGVVGLILVIWVSLKLANTIAGPIAALQQAAQTLEQGTRIEVAVTGRDEIGRLTASFNRMSAGILEREHRITHLALHDPLTNLPNQAVFRGAVDQRVARIAQSGDSVAVLCLDLDRFKAINDALGHPIGDALLCRVAELLVKLTPDGLVSRLGSDEFAIVLFDGFDPDRPRALAQAIIDVLSEPLDIAGHAIETGTSLGIAICPTDGSDAEQLLKNADLALYRAKQGGRGNFCFFEQKLDQAARERRQLELDLREAIKTGQFRLNYQPIYDLQSDTVGCFEALLRWEHPTRGDISPAYFIPLAEDTGLIVAIGEWVMHQACRQATEWPEHVRVAINVSPLQFRSLGFAAVVLQALARSGLAARRLEVEITESVFLDDTAPVLELLHRLHSLGIRIALDDFGTGYSSLSYLRSFPFDKIKIDKSFVDHVVEDPVAAAIVGAIVQLAGALDMETTAEGVEHQGQLDRLREQGCSSIQGYLFSRPLDGVAASRLVQVSRSAVSG